MSKYSKKPAFNPDKSLSPMTEFCWRIVALDKENTPFASGSCVLIAGNLLLTAKHIFEDFNARYGLRQESGEAIVNYSVWLIQLLNDPNEPYAVWEPDTIYLSPYSDLCLIYIRPYCDNAANYKKRGAWKQPIMQLSPPQVGDRIWGYGYHSSVAKVVTDLNEVKHYTLDDEPTSTVGEVKEIHHVQRDSIRLPFPCFQVNARFDGGMSGGPVFDDNGHLCGIICSNLPPSNEEEEHVSYVATLWPLMGTVINAGRGNNYPRDISYPVLELARDGLIEAIGWEKVKLHKNPISDIYERIEFT